MPFHLLSLLLFLACLTPLHSSWCAAGKLESKILEAINQERRAAGLGDLVADTALSAAAGEWAARCAQKNRAFHRNDLKQLMQAGTWATANENIYLGTGTITAPRVVRAWMNSPGHRRNLLHPRITAAGLGIARAADGTTYVVFNGAGR